MACRALILANKLENAAVMFYGNVLQLLPEDDKVDMQDIIIDEKSHGDIINEMIIRSSCAPHTPPAPEEAEIIISATIDTVKVLLEEIEELIETSPEAREQIAKFSVILKRIRGLEGFVYRGSEGDGMGERSALEYSMGQYGGNGKGKWGSKLLQSGY